MGFGNFLRGIAAQVNPFDNGKTYGSYNQPRKRRDDQLDTPLRSAPTSSPTAQISVQQPKNVFDPGLTHITQLGGQQNMVNPAGSQVNLTPLLKPQPGDVIKPQTPAAPAATAQPKPGWHPPAEGTHAVVAGTPGTYVKGGFIPDNQPKKPGFWGKVGNGFKTAGETAVGTVRNVPEVGLAAGRVATGLVEGVGEIPHIATAGVATATHQLNKHMNNAVTRQIDRGAQDANTGVKTATHYVVHDALDPINRNLDHAASLYEDHVGAPGGAQAYRTTQIPLNALAALVTLGGSTAAEGAAQGGKVSKLSQVMKFLTEKNIGGSEDGIVAKTAQNVSSKTAPVVNAIQAPFKAINSLIKGTPEPPTTQIPVTGSGDRGIPIPVGRPQPNVIEDVSGFDVPSGRLPAGAEAPPIRVAPTPQPIRELAGDRPGQVMPTAQDLAATRARNAFDAQPTARPDRSIDGISRPNTGNTGVYTQAEIQAERNALDESLARGEINQTAHKAANAELDGLTAHDAPATGRPIEVRKVNPISVVDETGAPPRINNVTDLSKTAKNSLENDTTGIKPNGVERSGGFVENGTAKPVEYRRLEDGSVAIVDGRHTLEYAKRNGIQDFPMKDVTDQYAPQVAKPASLPKVGSTLPDGRVVTKRMVRAARNNAKNAKALAKANERTAGAMETITRIQMNGRNYDMTEEQMLNKLMELQATPAAERSITHQDQITRLSKALNESRNTSVKPASDKGFVSSGEYRKGTNGNVSEVAHKHLEAAKGAQDTNNLSVQDVLNQSRNEIAENGVRSPETVRNLKAVRDSGRFAANSPEYKAVSDEYKAAISAHGRALSLTDKTARTSASGDQLTNRFTSKLIGYVEDPTKITDAHIASITRAENAFTEARDAATAAGERFKQTGNEADFKAWKAAQNAAEKADRDAKITEFNVSKEVLKGNKSLEASKAIQEAEKNAGVYSMDSIDANMLSGTGTMVRNYINTLFPRLENKLFGRLSSRLVSPIETVGGSSGRGARIGSSIGRNNYKADIAARKEAGVGFIRRTVTAGNTVGEQNIQATAYSKAFDHYKQLLHDEGYTGKELNNRAEFHVRTDPQGLVANYEKDALQANALSSLTHTKKIENVLADGVQRALANAGFGAKGQQAGRFGAKAVTRVGLGFPTVIAKSLAEGLKRATLGIPEAGMATAKFINTGNREAYAAELAKSIQHAGSGGGMIMLGRELGKHGVISGAYPSDPNERKRWEAEGRQENSIKIGGQWYSIPGYLGGFALPLMLGATTATGNIKDEASLKNAWNTVLAASPVDSIQSTLDIMTGNSSDAKIKNAATSLVRAATPAGSFLAELAKLTDSTKNDTSTKDALHNILDNVAGGIPILNNKVNTIDKLDAYGNVIHNPNKVATVLGAQGSEQSQGKQDVQTQQNAANDSVATLKDTGVIDNKTLMSLVDKKLAAKIASGQELKPEDVAAIQKSVTKGISPTDDSAWREGGDYATDKAAMQTKLQMLNADPTTKPSDKAQYETQIKRDDVLATNKIPYKDFKEYQKTGLDEWRNMGDPESDTYDPDRYQKLFAIDDALTKAGGSYAKDDPTTNKYFAKKPGKGRGSGSGSGGYSSDFGKLKAGTGAPNVQQYETIDQRSGAIPAIQVERPNIVHKIGFSG